MPLKAAGDRWRRVVTGARLARTSRRARARMRCELLLAVAASSGRGRSHRACVRLPAACPDIRRSRCLAVTDAWEGGVGPTVGGVLVLADACFGRRRLPADRP